MNYEEKKGKECKLVIVLMGKKSGEGGWRELHRHRG